MLRLPQHQTKTLLAIHGWSAVLLGLLLYAVIVTGVACVFAREIADWSSPLARAVDDPYPRGTDMALRRLAATVPAQYQEELFFYPRAGGRLYAFFHRHEQDAEGKPVERGVAAEIDPLRLEVLARREGSADALQHSERSNALADFMVEMHVRLHVPDPYGLLLTGVLGLAMLVAALSGLLIHRHLLREIFTLRRWRAQRGADGALLASRDAHVLAGSWNLPFSFILAFTGSYFSFASAFGIPAMAMVAFKGDQEAMIAAIVGHPAQEDRRMQATADLDAMLADVRTRSGVAPSFVQVEHWQRADARVTFFLPAQGSQLSSPTYVYDGASGAFVQQKPVLGLRPSLGGALADLMAPLHFGNFAGLLSKALWFALGFAAAYVALSGLQLWTQRRAESRAWRRLARAVHWVGYGLPLALIATAHAYFPARQSEVLPQEAMMQIFLLVTALSALAALLIRELAQLRRLLLLATALALLGLPVLRLLCGGPGWWRALQAQLYAVPALDLLLLAAGIWCLWLIRSPGALRMPSLRELRS